MRKSWFEQGKNRESRKLKTMPIFFCYWESNSVTCFWKKCNELLVVRYLILNVIVPLQLLFTSILNLTKPFTSYFKKFRNKQLCKWNFAHHWQWVLFYTFAKLCFILRNFVFHEVAKYWHTLFFNKDKVYWLMYSHRWALLTQNLPTCS